LPMVRQGMKIHDARTLFGPGSEDRRKQAVLLHKKVKCSLFGGKEATKIPNHSNGLHQQIRVPTKSALFVKDFADTALAATASQETQAAESKERGGAWLGHPADLEIVNSEIFAYCINTQ